MGMMFDSIGERLSKRAFRREYRAMVAQWFADGGDDKFRFDYELDKQSLVLDLGGYEGQWASDLYARQPCRILVFEPVRAYAENIAARFRANPDIEVFGCGLGASSRSETIYIRGASSSSYRKKGTTTEVIEIVDVSEWFREREIENIALMKVNIEGGEFELLERLIETGLIENIRDLQVQFHRIAADSSARMETIQRELAKSHALTYQYRFVWENWSRNSDDAS